MNDKKMMVLFNVEWNEDSVTRAVEFLQRAIREYREDETHSGGQYTPERLAKVGGLKEVVGARLLEETEEVMVVRTFAQADTGEKKDA